VRASKQCLSIRLVVDPSLKRRLGALRADVLKDALVERDTEYIPKIARCKLLDRQLLTH
jgi:hypothetical protein